MALGERKHLLVWRQEQGSVEPVGKVQQFLGRGHGELVFFSFIWMEALSCAVSQEDLELHLRPHFHGLGWVGWGLWLITALQHVLNSVMHGHHQGVTNSETKGH